MYIIDFSSFSYEVHFSRIRPLDSPSGIKVSCMLRTFGNRKIEDGKNEIEDGKKNEIDPAREDCLARA